MSEWDVEVPAKWVLSGEHSVLRGKHAIAFPYPAVTLKLRARVDLEAKRAGKELSITANPFQSQIKSLIVRACEALKLDPRIFDGTNLEIESQIPIGAGLGSSAALCVAVARVVAAKAAGISTSEQIQLATHLEDVFHGKSSGMDISVISHRHPILYSVAEGAKPLTHLSRFPKFQLFDSGKRGLTRDCIQQVNSQPAMSQTVLDGKMEEATLMARDALQAYSAGEQSALSELARAMNQAQDCFEAWGLVPPALLHQKTELLGQGALAVKLTGAGLGGFWVALWPDSGPKT